MFRPYTINVHHVVGSVGFNGLSVVKMTRDHEGRSGVLRVGGFVKSSECARVVPGPVGEGECWAAEEALEIVRDRLGVVDKLLPGVEHHVWQAELCCRAFAADLFQA